MIKKSTFSLHFKDGSKVFKNLDFELDLRKLG